MARHNSIFLKCLFLAPGQKIKTVFILILGVKLYKSYVCYKYACCKWPACLLLEFPRFKVVYNVRIHEKPNVRKHFEKENLNYTQFTLLSWQPKRHTHNHKYNHSKSVFGKSVCKFLWMILLSS